MTGVIQRVENGNVYVELGKNVALLPMSEQVEGETYQPGDRLKVYILKVDREVRGKDTPVIVSRKNREIVKRLFELTDSGSDGRYGADQSDFARAGCAQQSSGIFC